MESKFRSSYLIQKYNYFIFDFDGIIKESVDEKRKSFCKLFSNYQFAIPMIEKHHFQNCGISRYEKIPLYLKYCDLEPNPELVTSYLDKFSDLVTRLVIDSDWVPGSLSFLDGINNKENIFIVSATPKKELIEISKKINLKIPLNNIFGSPKSKVENINNFIDKTKLKKYIFFGDAISDSLAAKEFSIDFAYRKYALNFNQVPEYYTYIFQDFKNDFN